MKYNKTEPVTDLLRLYLRTEGLETPLGEYRLRQAWPKVAGLAVAAQTKHLFIQNQKLHVQILSPAIRHELMMRKLEMVDMLNREAGARLINDIVVR